MTTPPEMPPGMPPDPFQPDPFGNTSPSSYGTPPPPPLYGAPPPGFGPAGMSAVPGIGYNDPREHPRATLVLVLGLVSLLGLCCGPVSLAGLAAILFAKTARREISASGGRLFGGSKLTAGFVCGIIGLTVGALWVVALLVRR